MEETPLVSSVSASTMIAQLTACAQGQMSHWAVDFGEWSVEESAAARTQATSEVLIT